MTTLRLVNARPTHTTLGWVTSRPRRGDWRATLILKAAFALVPDGVAVPGDVAPILSGDDPAGPDEAPSYASDFIPYKPRGDFLVAATAHAPGGSPVPACSVSIGIGGLRKTLAVTGDRHWVAGPLGSQPSDPVPFLTMPIGYGRAFGGPRDRRNPAGCGTDLVLPNVERPDQRITTSLARPDPAGFGPLGPTWQPRVGRAGTYDERWLAQRWPWFPADFDWAFFNAAPPDQQFPHFRGDEELRFENLHPRHPRLRCRLPGVTARIFVERPDTFEDVPVRLDTIWADPAAERLVLVWRGVTAVDSPRLRPLATLCATLEPLGAPADLAAHRAAFMALKDEAADATAATAAAARAVADKHRMEAEQRIAAARAQIDFANEQAQAGMQTPKVAAWRARDKPPPSDPAATLARAADALRARDPARAKAMEDRLAAVDQSVKAAMDRARRFPEWTADSLRAALAEGTGLHQAKLEGLDLTGLDLSAADLREARLKGAKLAGARLDRADLTGSDLREADLSGASFANAELAGANLTSAGLAGAVFAAARLSQTMFARVDLTGVDFRGCQGDGTDFTGAVLASARFGGAVLSRAQFGGADVSDTDFTGATLHAADFAAANGPGVVMAGANLTNLRATRGARFPGGRFAGCLAPRSNWQQAVLEGADFSRAVLTEALFPEADLRGANLDRAHLQSASLDDARLAGARLTNANLLRASLERADLTDAVVESSNLYAAGLLDAVLDGASFRGSFLARAAGMPS